MKVGVRNYQSIESAALEVTGFTAVTGKSNLGKSALVRAIAAACFGQLGETFVRAGSNFAAVGLIFDDNTSLKWVKVPTGKKTPGLETTVEVNGVKHTKLGRDHSVLTAPLGFITIETSAGNLRPQLARQFGNDNVFLVGENETAIAEAFKILGRGDIVAKARDMVKRDWGKLASTLKIRKEDEAKLAAVVQQGVWVQEARVKLQATDDAIAARTARQEQLTRQIVFVQALKGWKEVRVPVPVEVRPLDFSLLGKLQRLRELQKEIRIPTPVSVKELDTKTLEKIKRYREVCALLQAGEQEIETQRSVASFQEKQVKAMEATLGYCPLCGAEFAHEHSAA